MSGFFKVSSIAVLLFLWVSCAQSESESYAEKEQASLDKWIELYVNTGGVEIAKREGNGVWVEWLSRSGSGERLSSGRWVELNYEARTLEDRLFKQKVIMSRYESVAKHEGTFSFVTHYVPHYMQFLRENLMEGQYDAMDGKMEKGDKMRLYLTSAMAQNYYRLTYTNGYDGQMIYSNGTIRYPSGVPIMIDMEIVNIIVEPEVYEKADVKAYAESQWGLTDADNIKIEVDSVLYFETTRANPIEADTIGMDSTARIFYTGRFLDGFVFDTNIGEDGHAAGRDTLSYAAYSYKPSSGSLINAFSEVFKDQRIRYNSSFRMVFVSKYGYGEPGNSTTAPSTIIQPYTPLIFEVKVLPKKDEE